MKRGTFAKLDQFVAGVDAFIHVVDRATPGGDGGWTFCGILVLPNETMHGRIPTCLECVAGWLAAKGGAS